MGEAKWEIDKREIGHWAMVTNVYQPQAWCATCKQAWPCETATAYRGSDDEQ